MDNGQAQRWAQLEAWTKNHTPSGEWKLVREHDRFWLEDSAGIFALTVTDDAKIKVVFRYVFGGAFYPSESNPQGAANNYASTASFICESMDAFNILMRGITSRSGWGDANYHPRRTPEIQDKIVVWSRQK